MFSLLIIIGKFSIVDSFHRQVSCQGLYTFNQVRCSYAPVFWPADVQPSASEMLRLAWLASICLFERKPYMRVLFFTSLDNLRHQYGRVVPEVVHRSSTRRCYSWSLVAPTSRHAFDRLNKPTLSYCSP